MKTLRFKSNLKCSGCINAIKPGMDNIKDLKRWRVFLDVSDKIIEAETEGNESETANQILTVVTEAGYKIEQIKE